MFMAWRSLKIKRLLVTAICISFLVAVYIGTIGSASLSQSKDNGKIYKEQQHTADDSIDNSWRRNSHRYYGSTNHHLGVIVPYRERFEELLTFVPFMHRYLNHKKISHDIVVVNQADAYRFNRAALINVGFQYVTSNERSRPVDYIVMHDVDLLPLNNELPYNFPVQGSVMHVAAPGLHPKYNYPTFIGGILIVTVSDYLKVDGMSNVYWGWGLEDDEFYVRLKQSEIRVDRPDGISTEKADTFRHAHSPKVRPRDTIRCYNQFNRTRRRDRLTGLHNVNYTTQSVSHVTVDEAPFVILNVKLECNIQISPWCDCSGNKTANFNPAFDQAKKSKKVKKRYLPNPNAKNG